MPEILSSYQVRQDRLSRQIARLERRLGRCEMLNRRYSWARLAAFLLIIIATWGAASQGNASLGEIVFVLTLALFITIVAFHRRLDRWTERFRIWQSLYVQELARLTLDWERLPTSAALGEGPAAPLALDLDLTGPRSLHALIDTAVSRQGSAMLAEWLTDECPDPEQILARQAVVRELAALPRFRKRLALIFRLLRREPLDGEQLLRWLRGTPSAQVLARTLPFATFLGVANVVLLALNIMGSLPPFWIITGLVYGAMFSFNVDRLNEIHEVIDTLDSELGKFQAVLQYLETYPLAGSPHVAGECAPFRDAAQPPTRILSRLKLVTTAAGLRKNQVVGLLLNLILPWDFWTAVMIGRYQERLTGLLPVWLHAFHRLEALGSLGGFSALNPDYTFPTIAAGSQPVLETHQMGHPLLPADRKVCNDFRVDSLGELSLITGSNMAGKSTFIRTIGVNLCLAFAGGPVNAASWRSLPFRLYTCIRISDSLGDGFSYFYAEVKRLKGLLDALSTDESQDDCREKLPLLYLIDEIFRGTNNRERALGSRSYVQALIGAAGIGLIATHDLELAHLAEEYPPVHNFHFRDAVQGDRLVFDYRLQSGPCPTTNALKIMRQEGLPVPEG